jgi:hypothetical protein
MLVPYRFHLRRNARLPASSHFSFHYFYLSKWKFIFDLASDFDCPWAHVKKCVLLSSLGSAQRLTAYLVIGGSTMPHSTCCPDTGPTWQLGRDGTLRASLRTPVVSRWQQVWRPRKQIRDERSKQQGLDLIKVELFIYFFKMFFTVQIDENLDIFPFQSLVYWTAPGGHARHRDAH